MIINVILSNCKVPIFWLSTWWSDHSDFFFYIFQINNLSLLHDKYVIVSADKAPNNIIFVCKSHYIDCLIKELGIANSLGNRAYTPTTLAKEEILDKHNSVLCSFGISAKDEELDLPSLYWIPKIHRCPFKQRYIAGSSEMLHETSFQIINMYSIGGQNRASELGWH